MGIKTKFGYGSPQKYDPTKWTQLPVGGKYYYEPIAPTLKGKKGPVTTTTLPGTPPPNGVPVPENILKKYKLPAGTMITFSGLQGAGSGGTTISGATPSSGKSLVLGIKESLPPAAAKALLKQWYNDANFNVEGKGASKIYNGVYGNIEVHMATTKHLTGTANTNGLISPETTGAPTFQPAPPKGRAGAKPPNTTVTNYNALSLAQNQRQFLASQKQQAGEAAATLAQSAKATAQANAISQEGITVGVAQATANTEASAFGTISNYLQTWGLQADAGMVHTMIMKAGDHVTDIDALLNAIRGNNVSGLGVAADIRLKQNYNAAFSGLEQYNKQPGAIHMNETQYQQYTSSIMNASTQYGAQQPTQKEIGVLLNGHVSPVEFQQRVTDIYAQVANADPAVKAALAREYGVNQNNLFAYYANPKNALQTMQRQVAGAEISDYGSRVGLNGLDKAGTNQLADMAKLAATSGNSNLGFGIGQIENSLLTASKDAALTKSAPGANAATVNTTQLIGAQLPGFGGTSQIAAETAVQRAEAAKAAPFEKGGGFVENAKGVSGIGGART